MQVFEVKLLKPITAFLCTPQQHWAVFFFFSNQRMFQARVILFNVDFKQNVCPYRKRDKVITWPLLTIFPHLSQASAKTWMLRQTCLNDHWVLSCLWFQHIIYFLDESQMSPTSINVTSNVVRFIIDTFFWCWRYLVHYQNIWFIQWYQSCFAVFL